MKRVLIFGTGSSAEKVLDNICTDNVDITGYLDNSVKKQGRLFHGAYVFPPEKCKGMEFDYILIAISASDVCMKVQDSLVRMGVGISKIIRYK